MDDWRWQAVEAVRDIATYDGQERRENEISGMMERMKRSISGRQQGIHIIGSEGEDLYLYNDELTNK